MEVDYMVHTPGPRTIGPKKPNPGCKARDVEFQKMLAKSYGIRFLHAHCLCLSPCPSFLLEKELSFWFF
jgi:hypothetical protein